MTAPTPAVPAIPEGWKNVPLEPTPEAASHAEECPIVNEIKKRLIGMIGNHDMYEQGYKWALEMIGIVGACPGDGSAFATNCKLASESPVAAPTAASKALDAAAPAGLEQTLIEMRIGLTPEYEGGWHATVYGDREVPATHGYGNTPSEAANAAIDGDKQGAQGDA